MSFDKKHYKSVRQHMTYVLNNRPWCVEVDDPVEWARVYIPMISFCNEQEDYEGAKATKDAIIEFINQFIPDQKDKLTTDILLRLENEDMHRT